MTPSFWSRYPEEVRLSLRKAFSPSKACRIAERLEPEDWQEIVRGARLTIDPGVGAFIRSRMESGGEI